MENIFRKKPRVLFCTLLCILIGGMLGTISIAAQGNGGNNTAEKNKNFKFEVVSIRPTKPGENSPKNPGIIPNGYIDTESTWGLMKLAYTTEPAPMWLSDGAMQILNGPHWIWNNYVIDARVADKDRDTWRNQNSHGELLRAALQNLLKDRFKLAFHEGTAETVGYDLVVIHRAGTNLQNTPAGAVLPKGLVLASGAIRLTDYGSGSSIEHYYNATMDDLTYRLSIATRRFIQNQTGLTGRYNFPLVYRRTSHDIDELPNNWDLGDLGLKLKRIKRQGATLVIDHIELPSPN